VSSIPDRQLYVPPGTDRQKTLDEVENRARNGETVIFHEHAKSKPCIGRCFKYLGGEGVEPYYG
jgi:hypothetical protein